MRDVVTDGLREIWNLADIARSGAAPHASPIAVLGYLAATISADDHQAPPDDEKAASRLELAPEFRPAVSKLGERLAELAPIERARATDALFNGVLGSDAESELHTPPDVNELLVRLATADQTPEAADVWYDPACGTAGSASAVHSVHGIGAGRFLGQELSDRALRLARLRSRISGQPLELHLGDTFQVDGFEAAEASFALCAPPFGLKLAKDATRRLQSLWPDVDTVRESSALFALASLSKLRPEASGGGTAAVLTLPRVLANKTEGPLRQWLVESGLIVGVVQLPNQLLNNTNLATTVLVLSTRPERHRETFRMVDATGIFADQRERRADRQRLLGRGQAERIAEEFWSDANSRYARSIPVSQLRHRRLRVARSDENGADVEGDGLTFSMELPDSEGALESIQSSRYPPISAATDGEVTYRLDVDDSMGTAHEARRAYFKSFGDELSCLGQVVRSATAVRGSSSAEEWTDNSILITRVGGRIDTSPPDEGHRVHGLLVDLDPSFCTNEYAALVLGGPNGKVMVHERFDGSRLGAVTRDQLLSARVPLPGLEEQAALVAEWRRLDVLAAEVVRLKSSLAGDYRRRVEIVNEVATLTETSGLDTWLQTVPYPVASAIWAYRSMNNASDRLDQLVKAFESAAEFVAMVLLSACDTDDDLASQVFPDLSTSLTEGGMSMERASFGTWTTAVTLIAKRFRSMLTGDAESLQRCLRAFRTNDEGFVRDLTSTELGALFKEVNALRNRWIGHSGIRSERESLARVEELLSHLVDLQRLMLHTWRRAILVSPGQSTYRKGSHTYSARRLSGLSVPFENIEIQLAEPMEDDRLHLYFDDEGSALELAPIVQLGPAPSASSDSFYFFNRLDSADRVRLVSYHHPDSPELFSEGAGVREFVQSISQRTSSS